jgi:D-alanine-D-alanine ligase-like ATP-grasp enzyme
MGRICVAEEEEFPGQAELWEANRDRSLRGRKGQAALRELETALLELPEKRLIANHLKDDEGGVCALAALAKYKGAELPEEVEAEYDDEYGVAIQDQMVAFGKSLGVPRMVAIDIVYQNDDTWWKELTPEERYRKMLNWTQRHITHPQRV